jgi:hypothetical protein
MERYETRIEDGQLYLGELEVGPMADVLDIVGETYVLEYDEKAQAMGWMDTDDGRLELDTRESILDMSFDARFCQRIEREPLDGTTPEGYPVRTSAFADLLTDVWDAKGSIEID